MTNKRKLLESKTESIMLIKVFKIRGSSWDPSSIPEVYDDDNGSSSSEDVLLSN